MESALQAFFDVAYDDPAFRIALFSTLVLTALALSFGMLAIVLRFRRDRADARRAALEAEWESGLMDVLDGRKRAEDLAATVARADLAAYLDLLYRIGRHLHGAHLDVVRCAAAPFLPDLVQALDGQDAETRAKYIQILGVLGFDEHHDVILRSLGDASPLVAMVAARALMRRGRHAYARDVLQRLSRFETWSGSTLSSLLAVMGPGASPALREALWDERQPVWVRVTVARALEKLHDFESADLAVALVQNDPPSELLCASLDLLGSIGREEHVPLLRACCNHADEEVRISAISALGRLSGNGEAEALLRSIGDESPWVAMNAARSLKKLEGGRMLREIAASGHERAALIEQILLEP